MGAERLAAVLLMGAAALTGTAAFANGSAMREGVGGIGGIEFVKNTDIELSSETLEISAELIKVNYVFRNH
jgi:hypothetical protein